MIVAAASDRSLRVLSADQVRAIHQASLRVLSQTGVAMPLAPERQTQARELGLRAVEVIEAVGPGGHFMEQEHTRGHMREIWQPALLDRMPLEAWREAGRPTARSKARERAREILAAHQPEPLHCEQQIREIVRTRSGSAR